MSEMIKLLSEQPANIIIFNAMAKVCDDVCEHFKILPNGDETTAKIEVFVNGISVPFEASFSEVITMLIDNYEKDVKEEAIKLITESSLSELYNDIQNAEWNIREKLEKIMEDK